MIWFTSDTHFYHKQVISYCNRPWSSMEEMHEGLIKNWNDRIRSNKELVYVLGDFCFASGPRLKEIVNRLNGQKILIRGNHDHTPRKMIEAGFYDVRENERMVLPNRREVYLSHFPYLTGSKDQRYLYKRISDNGSTYLLHGHVHQEYTLSERQLNVGVDVWNWFPIHHEQIQHYIETDVRNRLLKP
jgi:calcineurin-like phosphoesterase family protein